MLFYYDRSTATNVSQLRSPAVNVRTGPKLNVLSRLCYCVEHSTTVESFPKLVMEER